MNAPKRQVRNAEQTRRQLIEAGERLFASHGYSGTSLEALAGEVGVNKAMIAYYFGSKAGVYDAVISALVSSVVGQVRDALITGPDPVENFRNYIDALAKAFAARPTFPAIVMREYLDGEMQDRETPFAQVMQFFRMTEELYQQGRKAGLFRSLSAHELHLSIVGPLIHFTLTIGFRDRTFDRVKGEIENPGVSEFSDHLANLLIDGMRSDTKTQKNG